MLLVLLFNLEFNNIRYWDIRENIPIKYITIENQLKSSADYRKDSIYLEQGKYIFISGNLEQAQIEKEILENIQRKNKRNM